MTQLSQLQAPPQEEVSLPLPLPLLLSPLVSPQWNLRITRSRFTSVEKKRTYPGNNRKSQTMWRQPSTLSGHGLLYPFSSNSREQPTFISSWSASSLACLSLQRIQPQWSAHSRWCLCLQCWKKLTKTSRGTSQTKNSTTEKQVKVGDIIKIKKDSEFPADLLLLASSKEVVFVDTMNLDGETNLKEKFVFMKDFNTEQISKFDGHVVCDPPNASLDEWDGNIHTDSSVLNSKYTTIILIIIVPPSSYIN